MQKSLKFCDYMLFLYVDHKYQIINSLIQTQKLATDLLKLCTPGISIFLSGPVGIGKSTIVRLMLEELGLQYRGSPTFGLMSIYQTANYSILHMDLYNKPNKVIEEVYEFQDHVFLVEWPSKEIEKIFPNPIRVDLAMDKNNRIARIWY